MRVVVIRFSSFGDIIQALPAIDRIKSTHATAQIIWVTRDEFAAMLASHPNVDRVISIERGSGLRQLWQIRAELCSFQPDLVFDAHNNLRSLLLRILLGLSAKTWHVRSKNRIKRFLLFYLRINLFPKPFRGAESFINALPSSLVAEPTRGQVQPPEVAWRSQLKQQNTPQNAVYWCLAPGAAWPKKMWPQSHWQALIKLLLANNPQQKKLVLMGGPREEICLNLKQTFGDQITIANSSGWLESCAVIANADGVVGGDTGILHLSDYLRVPNWILIGPTAFGYPHRDQSQVMEIELSCKPCSKDGRGGCTQKIYQRCLVEITPEQLWMKCRNLWCS